MMLRYLYTDELDLSSSTQGPLPTLQSCWRIAHEWSLEATKKVLEKTIAGLVDYSNIADVLTWRDSFGYWHQTDRMFPTLGPFLQFWLGHRAAILPKTPIWKKFSKNQKTYIKERAFLGTWIDETLPISPKGSRTPTKVQEKCIIC